MKTPIHPNDEQPTKPLEKNSFNSQRANPNSESSDSKRNSKSTTSPMKRNTGHNANKIICQYCNDTFLTEAGLRSHVSLHCDKKQFLLCHANCQECGTHCEDFDSFCCHLNETGHAHRNGRIRSTSGINTSVVLVDYPKQMQATNIPSQKVATMERAGIIFFSGFVLPGASISGCAWVLTDETGTVLTQGSSPVHQSVPSLPSALKCECQALMNGLSAAIENNILSVVIKTSSETALSYLHQLFSELESTTSELTTNSFYGMYDLCVTIRDALKRLSRCDLELVLLDQNYLANKMAENIVADQINYKDSLQISSVTVATTSTSTTINQLRDRVVSGVGQNNISNISSSSSLSLLEVSEWLRNVEPLFKMSPRAEVSPREYGRTPKNNNAFTSWGLPSNLLG